MSRSIISNERVCYICETPSVLHKHHIFYGTANRKNSEKYGCWVYLCANHHNMSNAGVHFDKDFDRFLKRLAQIKFEECNGSREDFIKIFGKNYL